MIDGKNIRRLRMILVLGYWVLANIRQYWVLGDISIGCQSHPIPILLGHNDTSKAAVTSRQYFNSHSMSRLVI